ncbi:MAG: radical SAM protein [Myxococcales bacterium]|nr:radical SAM protein [Myxococcales bacterium]
MSLVEHLSRVVDDQPWAAHLYVTDNCNLDCHYCNEYDNSVPHPETADLKRWMRKIRELGVARIGFQGGEPLLHPDIVELVRYAKSLGFFKVSMSSNAFLLKEEHIEAFERAGLDSLQISVDRMTPIESTKKSLKSVQHKLAWFEGSSIKLNVSGVLFNETLEEAAEVIEHCLEQDVSVHARVIHDDIVNDRKLRLHPSTEPLLRAVEHQAQLKAAGERIHTSWNILEYQKAMLEGRPMEWTCTAGYKYFFVSATGKFWLCSQVRTERDIMDITPEILRSYNEPKDCQQGCGVYCTVDTSLAVNDPVAYLSREARGRAQSGLRKLRAEGEKRFLSVLSAR